MKTRTWKDFYILFGGKKVETKDLEYNHVPEPKEYYQLNEKYSKLLVKLMKLKGKNAIDKHILNFRTEAEEVKKTLLTKTDIFNHTYIRNIDEMVLTLDKFPK